MKQTILSKYMQCALLLLVAGAALTGCDKDGVNGYRPVKPVGGFNSSGEIAADNLVAHWAFEGAVIDSANNVNGTANGTSFQAGRKGQALKGNTGAWVTYNDPGSAITSLQSFTIAMWVNTQKHDGGAQCVFMLPRTNDFWGNMFLLFEGNTGASDSMIVKLNFGGKWAEHLNANRFPSMYGAWKHLAFTYNAVTGKYYAYLNGVKLNQPDMEGRLAGATPFVSYEKFIIGGFQQHLGISGAPQGWMLNYTGLLDEFRIYDKPLEDAEINSLYKLEALGR